MPAFLSSLALGAFTIGTEGFMIAGILPLMASDLSVSVAKAGYLVTAFSLTYAFGSPILAMITGNLNRKTILSLGLIAFTLSNLLSAYADSFISLLLIRIFLGLSAGLFMPNASAYAANAVEPERRGRALSFVYSGMTVALVVGVPLGTFLGSEFGWRSTFLGVAALASLSLLGVLFFLPEQSPSRPILLKERLSFLRQTRFLNILLLTIFGLGGAFTVYTYLAEYLQRTIGLPASGIGFVLMMFGFASALGNQIGGYSSDKGGAKNVALTASLVLFFAFLSLSYMELIDSLQLRTAVILLLIVFWGLAGWAFTPAQQSRLVSLQPESSSVLLSLNASAIYIGISLGSLVGSTVVAHSSVGNLGIAGAAFELSGLILLIITSGRPLFRKRSLIGNT
ncbi:transporter, major facilitator family protein [Leptospira fainei serovar Hurstbridge str. BUT 6]|uniref:Transporter, major facilitator family protein n=1 Tax=Leptospira fainei serovar Hurstbridge str. BUT 6 TaxID=1193011 RepID=S3V9Z8_9LEPT|nr:MFS transporter [Leptospira fainei]EPG73270.1 transporter, major facilitator family protein [Leptospira fainei serovar Hurstbridge str. BUT 6]